MRPARMLAAAGLLAASLALSSGAGAVPPDETGWWWRAQQAPVPLPPPTTEDGQLVVADAPDGPLAVAALRFTFPAGDTAPVLTLRPVNDGGATLALEACPPASRWFPAEAGPWAERPQADCDRGRVAGQRAEDGSWTFALAPLADEGYVDVVLQPAVPASGVRQPGSVTFQPPGADALTTTPGAPEDSFAPTPEPEPFAPEPVPADPPLGVGDLDDLALPDPPTPQVSDVPSLGATAGRIPRAAPVSPAATPVAARQPSNRSGLAALLLFAGAAIAATRLHDRPLGVTPLFAHVVRTRRPVAEPETAGLGRFVRPRVGKPNPLT